MESITREEQFLNAVAEGTPPNIKPVTREELFLAKAAGQDVKTPTPITRKEMFLKQVAENAGGGSGQDHTVEDGLITGTLTDLVNNRVESVRDYAFYKHTNLASINLPSAASVGEEAFCGCSSVVRICLPLLKTMKRYVFSSCSMLEAVDLGAVGQVGYYAFNSCKQLKCVVLRGVAILPNVAAVSGSPFATNGTGGTALVPRASIETYQNATNWSTLYAAGTCTFLPLEDYTVDGTTTGEIDWSKIEGVTE